MNKDKITERKKKRKSSPSKSAKRIVKAAYKNKAIRAAMKSLSR